MKNPEQYRENDLNRAEESVVIPEKTYQALRSNNEQEILASFTPEQQVEICQKQRVLSSLAYFIGKDFRIPVELNMPGAG